MANSRLLSESYNYSARVLDCSYGQVKQEAIIERMADKSDTTSEALEEVVPIGAKNEKNLD